jgi:hypothetical protein
MIIALKMIIRRGRGMGVFPVVLLKMIISRAVLRASVDRRRARRRIGGRRWAIGPRWGERGRSRGPPVRHSAVLGSGLRAVGATEHICQWQVSAGRYSGSGVRNLCTAKPLSP